MYLVPNKLFQPILNRAGRGVPSLGIIIKHISLDFRTCWRIARILPGKHSFSALAICTSCVLTIHSMLTESQKPPWNQQISEVWGSLCTLCFSWMRTAGLDWPWRYSGTSQRETGYLIKFDHLMLPILNYIDNNIRTSQHHPSWFSDNSSCRNPFYWNVVWDLLLELRGGGGGQMEPPPGGKRGPERKAADCAVW